MSKPVNRTHRLIPDGLAEALGRWNGKYTTAAEAIYYRLALDSVTCVGVFGEHANSSYEWFVYRSGHLETSNAGYGSPPIALRDILNRECPDEEALNRRRRASAEDWWSARKQRSALP